MCVMKKSSQGPIKAVLFDLGKVIVNFNFSPAFERLSKSCKLKPDEIRTFFYGCEHEVLYDGGKISSTQFFSRIKRQLNHCMDYDAFKSTWNEVFTPNEEIIRLIRALKKKHRLVLISNTNPMHYAYIRKKYPVLSLFDHMILSYKLKIRKPDWKIYEAAKKACRAEAHEILYIDDRIDFTDAAAGLGFNTFTFKQNPKDLVKKMKALKMDLAGYA